MECDTDYHFVKNTNQNSRYYVLKKRTISHGDDHTVNTAHGTKFGRKLVKAVTYRVKSVSAATKTTANDTPEFSSHSEIGSGSLPDDANPGKISIVSLGKSPSYKEVALAPPGTISKLQVYNPQSEIPAHHDLEEQDIEAHANTYPTLEEVKNLFKEKDEDSLSDSLDDSQDTKVSEKNEVTLFTGAVQNNFESAKGLESGDVQAYEAVDNIIMIVEDPADSQKLELDTNPSGSSEFPNTINSISQENEDLRANISSSSQVDGLGIPAKKLSASAAPFNPSSGIARAPPVAMNITLPTGPGAVPPIGPWPVNMNVHHGPATVLPAVTPMCSSPHHAYPSPAPTPNMIQPLPFMYPPYTQPQSIPTSNFPVTSSAIHANLFSWQCNMNPTVSKYGPNAAWPGHLMEFPLPAPVIDPIPDSILEPREQCHVSQSSSSALVLREGINNVRETKNEVKVLESETRVDEVDSVHSESVKENGNPNFHGFGNAGNKLNHNITSNDNTSRREKNMDGEKTFSILIRGRRNRKQILRMPISLLTRPNSSQSFKVVHNRVVRGSDVPKSINLSSSKDCTATA